MADVLDDDGVDDALRRILATRARVWRALQRRSEDGER
jgi:hypothetical protein